MLLEETSRLIESLITDTFAPNRVSFPCVYVGIEMDRASFCTADAGRECVHRGYLLIRNPDERRTENRFSYNAPMNSARFPLMIIDQIP